MHWLQFRSVAGDRNSPHDPGLHTGVGGGFDAEGRDCDSRALVVAPAVGHPGPSVAEDLDRYEDWLARFDAGRAQVAPTPDGPAIGIVVVGRAARPDLLTRLVGSLVAQTYRHWLLLAPCLDDRDAPAALAVVGQRLRTVACAPGTSDASAAGEAVGRGYREGVAAFMVVGESDVMAPGALDAVARALGAGADVVYGDHDVVADDGSHRDPHLKPDWSPDLLLGTDYLARPVTVSAAIMRSCGGPRPAAETAWEYDLVLRATESARSVVHIDEVLLHSGSPVSQSAPSGADVRAAVGEAVTRRGIAGHVEPGPTPAVHYVRRTVSGDPVVSIIVPFRDGAPLLRRCVDSIRQTVRDQRFELVLVDNASTEPETIALISRLSGAADTRIVRDPQPFNWATINNAAVLESRGDVLLFLNNDTAPRRAGWLTAMLEQALRDDVGAVGARLVYPGGELQHIGVVVGLGGAAGHVLRGLPGDEPGYQDMAVTLRETSAVTGACLMTRRSCFEAVGGFDGAMPTDLNDIDYCLRLSQAAWKTVFTPLAELVHDESPTRGSSGNIDSIRFFLERWEPLIRSGDPFLNRNITRMDGSCSLRRETEQRWWVTWRSSLEPQPTMSPSRHQS